MGLRFCMSPDLWNVNIVRKNFAMVNTYVNNEISSCLVFMVLQHRALEVSICGAIRHSTVAEPVLKLC